MNRELSIEELDCISGGGIIQDIGRAIEAAGAAGEAVGKAIGSLVGGGGGGGGGLNISGAVGPMPINFGVAPANTLY